MDVRVEIKVETLTLVLGGARSGKSELAERLAVATGDEVTVVAAGGLLPSGSDPEWDARVEAHRSRRPPDWETVEVAPGGDLAGALRGLEGTVIVDSLGAWLAGVPGFAADLASLDAALAARPDATIVVSDEVGLGVHPSTYTGNQFRDALGVLNRHVSCRASQVYLAVAGRAVLLGDWAEVGRDGHR
ncbi:MAG: bifunctional adenosylcobinamide kinase/adenosylcobinamide-phosphate guanylyltransferase [Actinomycetota bacterium]|nr:bifunctional adenosylcobinamide kinase/adenosylcobinamide-phosphate guanylyltransferase [Actinomycetota bacterium]